MPINVAVLRALAEGPMSLMDLRRAAGSPPATTMRGHLRTLTGTGAVVRNRRDDFPGTVDFELAGPGRDLLEVAETVASWLALSPIDPLELGTVAAKSSLKALVEGWATNMIRALCVKRLCLTELSGLITNISYPSLERRVTAMRLAGLIEACSGGGRSTPYVVTDWLRRAVAVLAAAIRWERAYAREQSAPMGRRDVEAMFLLALPLLRLGSDAEGTCRLVVEIGRGENHALSGVTAEIQEGQLVSCVSRLEGDADTWAVGPVSAWLDTFADCEYDQLELGGNAGLARDVLEGVYGALQQGNLATLARSTGNYAADSPH